MNSLTTEAGFVSLNKQGEQLCGDRVEWIEQPDGVTLVLADGLGSGVKANILSTLTAKIIATMMAEGLPVEECVRTIASTLPVCQQRQVAYSTFTILQVRDGSTARIIQFDNPSVILLRAGKNCPYPMEELWVDDKKSSPAPSTFCRRICLSCSATGQSTPHRPQPRLWLGAGEHHLLFGGEVPSGPSRPGCGLPPRRGGEPSL